MDRDLLSHLPILLAVARYRSFAAAAAELGISASAVSHAVRAVEIRIGATLFARTTRSVGLTEAGETVLRIIAPALENIADVIEQVRAARGRVTGTLRLNAPRVALAMIVTPILARLARTHPELTVEITSDDALSDIVAHGFDAGIRLGEMIARDMVAVRLTPPFRAILVAAPGYVAARGCPQAIGELRLHNCIGFRLLSSGARYAWELRDGDREVAVEVTDASYARDLALAGVGIAYVFEPLVLSELREGRLTRLLADTAITEPGLFIYFPRRSSGMPKLRAFLDAARETLTEWHGNDR